MANLDIASPGTDLPALQAAIRSLAAPDLADWVVAPLFGGAAVGMTFATRAGRSTLDGKWASVRGTFTLSAKGSSVGNLTIALPWTAATRVGMFWGGWISYQSNLVTITDIKGIAVASGGANLAFYNSIGGLVSDANLSNNSQIMFGIDYEVA